MLHIAHCAVAASHCLDVASEIYDPDACAPVSASKFLLGSPPHGPFGLLCAHCNVDSEFRQVCRTGIKAHHCQQGEASFNRTNSPSKTFYEMKTLSAIVALALSASATARTFTVYNGCPFTIW